MPLNALLGKIYFPELQEHARKELAKKDERAIPFSDAKGILLIDSQLGHLECRDRVCDLIEPRPQVSVDDANWLSLLAMSKNPSGKAWIDGLCERCLTAYREATRKDPDCELAIEMLELEATPQAKVDFLLYLRKFARVEIPKNNVKE